MHNWELHWLEAEGSLQDWRGVISEKIAAASTAVSRLVPSSHLDILVQQGSEVIPQMGLVCFTNRKSLFSLVIEPENPNFAASLADGTITRMVVHEVHHCLRMAVTGYGRTLGDALVSEGLAGHFVRALMGNPPEPWERAVSLEELKQHLPEDDQLASTDYDHESWFFGAAGPRPMWLGYTLGYEVVRAWVRKKQPQDAETWTSVLTEEVLSVGMRELRG